MSLARVPWLATLLVLAAVGLMVDLGVWQLHRLAWKEGLLSRYAAAEQDTAVHPLAPGAVPRLYSRASVVCLSADSPDAESGRDASGGAGWAHVERCHPASGAALTVVLGWSMRPDPVTWPGGAVSGTLGPRGKGFVLVADPPLAGLAANARPDPRNIPNNHLSYAMQWFAFAAIAVVIYGIALGKRLKGK